MICQKIKQGVWSVDPAHGGSEAGWSKFTWEKPVLIRDIVFFQKTAWTLDDCRKDYEVYIGDAAMPVARGTLGKKSGPQSILLDKPYTAAELTLKFTDSYGGTPDASEVLIFPRKATTTNILRAMGGWRLAGNPCLFLHLRSFVPSDPGEQDIAALIAEMKKEHGGKFDATRFEKRLSTLTNDDPDDDANPLWGYRMAPLEKPRFRIAGTITLENPLLIRHPDITIAGQTAPGDGVCIRGWGIDVYANNVIIRFLRVRPGDVLGKPIRDAISGRFVRNVILDHCSMSWSMDEICTWYALGNVTVQWCLMSESLDRSLHPKGGHGAGHATGGLNLSSHHNFIADNSFRNPRFGGRGALTDSIVDFRNNVVYNFVTSDYGGEGGTYNFVHNYYKRGPSSRSGHFLTPYRHNVIGYGK